MTRDQKYIFKNFYINNRKNQITALKSFARGRNGFHVKSMGSTKKEPQLSNERTQKLLTGHIRHMIFGENCKALRPVVTEPLWVRHTYIHTNFVFYSLDTI